MRPLLEGREGGKPYRRTEASRAVVAVFLYQELNALLLLLSVGAERTAGIARCGGMPVIHPYGDGAGRLLGKDFELSTDFIARRR